MAGTETKARVGHVRIGFEAEFLMSRSKLHAARKSPEDDIKSFLGDVSMGSRLARGESSRGLDYSQWNLVNDGSIVINDPDEDFPIELVSPVLSYPDFLESIESTFQSIRAWGVPQATNDSCGLHLNVSLDGVQLKDSLDLIKLVLFLGESHIAGLFDRESNQYAQRIEPYIRE